MPSQPDTPPSYFPLTPSLLNFTASSPYFLGLVLDVLHVLSSRAISPNLAPTLSPSVIILSQPDTPQNSPTPTTSLEYVSWVSLGRLLGFSGDVSVLCLWCLGDCLLVSLGVF